MVSKTLSLSSRPELTSVSWRYSDLRQSRLEGVVPAGTHRMEMHIQRLHYFLADALSDGKHLREQERAHFKTRFGRGAPDTREYRLESA